MKAITFLGAAKAYDIAYYLEDGREQTAPFFGAALPHFYPDLSLRVLVTPEARSAHLDQFVQLVEPRVADLEAVDIAGGRTEEELWQIFEAVIDLVDDREQVIFDITHGFRSLPFLSFLAAAYLRVIKNVELVAVLYGNFEARDKSVEPNRAPVIDLTPFVGLLDWMVAADRFIRFGDAHDLAERLRQSRPDYRNQQADHGARELAMLLSNTAAAMDRVSSALRLIRPADAMVASDILQTQLVDATQGIQRQARPFHPLSQRVVDEYAPLALAESVLKSDLPAVLARERTMVHWYLDRRQYVQTIAVAREWIVTWLMAHLGFTDQNDRDVRLQVENAVGQMLQQHKGKRTDEPLSLDLKDVPQLQQAVTLYGELGRVRNDLLHAGKRRDAGSAESLEKRIIKLCRRLSELRLPTGNSTREPDAP